MKKTKRVLRIKTALVRLLYLILLIFALLLLPAVAFASGVDDSETEIGYDQSQSGNLNETLTAGTFDSPADFDQEPDFDFENSEIAPSAEIQVEENEALIDGNPVLDPPLPSLDEQQIPEHHEQQVSAEQPDLDYSDSPNLDFAEPTAIETIPSSPVYFQVEQVSMSPLLQPGNIIELTSIEYADGDLVIAQMADGTYMVKMMDGDLLVPLGAGLSYNKADLTILGKAGLSSLTISDLEADGVSYNSVLAQTATAPALGTGIPDDPYQIASLENLYWIAADNTRWSAYYKQTAHIDASATSEWFSNAGWAPIGNQANNFNGTYDGDGFSINSLYIDRPATSNIGLFGVISATAVLNHISLIDGNHSPSLNLNASTVL